MIRKSISGEEEETQALEELQKDFPPSKESSISFPSIDNVNKKLSDLFDYIGKHTMDESEEKEELEERKVEAEIEKAKAETYRAIRESERKFGSSVKREISGWKMYTKEREQIKKEIESKRNQLNDVIKENNTKFKKQLEVYKANIKKSKEFSQEEYKKIREKLLARGIEVPEQYKNYFDKYQEAVEKIIKKDNNDKYYIAEELPPGEAQLFIEMFAMLVFFNQIKIEGQKKEEIKKKGREDSNLSDEQDMFIKFILALDFIGGDAKDNLIKNLLRIYNTGDTQTKQTKLQNDEIKYNQQLDTLKLRLKKKTDFIERLNIELSTNKKSYEDAEEIYQRIITRTRKIENEIEEYQNNLSNTRNIDEIDNCKKRIKEKYPSLELNDNDFNDKTMLLSKILHNSKDPYKDLYDSYSEQFRVDRDEIKKINVLDIFNDKPEIIPPVTFDKPGIISTVTFDNYKELCNNNVTYVQKYLENLNELIQKDNRKLTGSNKKLKKLKKNIAYLEESTAEIAKRLSTLNSSDLEKLDVIFQAIKDQKTFEEESKSINIYLKSYGYKNVEDFLERGQEEFNMAIKERLNPFKISIKDVKKVGDKEKEFLNNKVFTIKKEGKNDRNFNQESATERDKQSVNKNFFALNTQIQNFIFSLIPVRTVLNFSTVVKPQGEVVPREIMEPDGFNGIIKADVREKLVRRVSGFYTKKDNKIIYDANAKFKKYTKNALVNTAIAHKEDGDDKIPLENILGKEIQLIKINDREFEKQKFLGPFYKIFHTSNDDEDKREYTIQSDIVRLGGGEIDHITYAGYGFSGSGKTYTLIESENSILSKIINSINSLKNVTDISIDVYEDYKEKFDKDCNIACSNKLREMKADKNIVRNDNGKGGYFKKKDKNGEEHLFFRKTIELSKKLSKKIELSTLIEDIKDINKGRKINKIHSSDTEFYRTSIRRTSYNDQSSRAHMFIDIKFKVNSKPKKITVLDMAGSEKVQVIQDDYFKTTIGYKVDNETFASKIKSIVKEVNDTTTGIKGKDEKDIMIYFNDNILNLEETSYRKKGKNRYYDEVPTQLKKIVPIIKSVIDVKQIIPETGNYKIDEGNVGNWKELNQDLNIDKETLTNFTTNYNTYQDYDKIEVIKNLHSTIKKNLENEQIYNEIDVTYFNFIHGEKGEGSFPRFRVGAANEKENTKKIDMSRCLYTVLKSKLNTFFDKFGLPKIKNFYKLDKHLVLFYNQAICKRKDENVTQCSVVKWKEDKLREQSIKCMKVFAEIYAKFYKDFSDMIDILEKYVEEIPKTTRDFYKNKDNQEKIQSFIQQKQNWDKNIITKYHCPLRFQGNAINDSIEEFKKNLSSLNNGNDIKEGTFPINVDKWTEGFSKNQSNPKREFVVFTNVRLDFTEEDFDKEDNEAAIANSFSDSLQFANDILNTRSSNFGKKVKKTSTRSFRKRGRRRAPSGTEIL